MPSCLVALDLDGTLLTAGSTIPAGHERAVGELKRLGAEVVIVTGRALSTTRWIWSRLGLTSPLGCFNGAWVGLPGRRPIAHAFLGESDVNEILRELRAFDGVVSAYPDAETWVMDRVVPRTRGWSDHYRVRIDIAPERFQPWKGISCKVMFVADPAALPTITARLRERLGRRFHVVASEADRVEILPAGITKAWGLAHLARHVGIERDRVWAVGDADNDLEMIRWAGHGCAMGHAHDGLRRQARHVLPSIHARGLCALPRLIEQALASGPRAECARR